MAVDASQFSVTVVLIAAVVGPAVRNGDGARPLVPARTRVPVLSGSSMEVSVAGPVVLVGSAVESQTAESEVKSPVAEVAVGARGGTVGHEPGPLPVSRPSEAVPTNRSFWSKSAAPEAPGP